MQRARFRLAGISIEGFKGFTDKQDIPISGKHVFLFGENRCGKSSIVEAIRWCLFGLADRPETEVRNAFYAPSECHVELELQASDGTWHVRRSLRPGAERSRLVILDPTGKEALQSNVFPYLARMGPREGTHVIFAAQQAWGRRPQADISDFHKVLYAYLHLEEVPDMLERLDKLLEEQQNIRNEVASKIGNIEDEIRTRLDQVNVSLNELLRSPPWTDSATPTHAESNAKIDAFVSELAELAGQSVSRGSPEELLERTEEWLQILTKTSRGDLEKELHVMQDRAKTIKNLLEAIAETEKRQTEAKGRIEQLRKEMSSTCEGQSLDKINEMLKSLHDQLVERDAKLAIAKEAEKYCKSRSVTECPVCLAKYSESELTEKVKTNIEKAAPEQTILTAEFDRLQRRCTKATELDSQLEEAEAQLQKAEKEQDLNMSQMREVLNVAADSPLNEEDVKVHLGETENSAESLETALQSAEFKHAELDKRIDALRTELRFHKYRSEQERLQRQLTVGLQSIYDQLRELTELDNTVHEIRKELKQAFDEAIDRAIPYLNEMMTDVYGKLTGQASFEKIIIQRVDSEGGSVLRFRVGSSRIPGQFFDPEDVLNGQANSALRLVPYFVFSQFQAETLELDLLLIDDPSQSFDTSHVGSLLQELANAGSHAQLIIATHEEDRFSPLLNEHFHAGDYEVIRFKKFDPEKGPSLAIN